MQFQPDNSWILLFVFSRFLFHLYIELFLTNGLKSTSKDIFGKPTVTKLKDNKQA